MVQRCPFYCIIVVCPSGQRCWFKPARNLSHDPNREKFEDNIIYNIYSAPAVRCAVVTEQIAAITNRQTKFNDVIDYFSV